MHARTAITVFLVSCASGAIASPVSSHSHPESGRPGPHGTHLRHHNTTYDYVIVGGGTAGNTLAARLAQNPKISVAVIEAGGYYTQDVPELEIPADCILYSGTFPNDTNPKVDWNFVTVPQAGANDRRLHYARGKTLGGSSARNYLVYQRPTSQSLDLWASDVGDQSYTFDNLLPFYQDGIAYTPPNLTIFTNITATADPPGTFSSNSAGPLQVSYDSINDAFNSWASKAFLASGMKNIDGFNTGNLIGSGIMSYTIDPKTAQRSSSLTSFLNEATKNTTLAVYHHTLAQKLLFRGNIATGVSVSTNGSKPYIISARKEVIVSAGAFQSPQLLMVSGIGPRETLEALKIPVVKDLAGVGQNLWDQPFWGISNRVKVPTASSLIDNPAVAAAAAQLYQEQHTGPLSISAGAVFGWEKFPESYRNNFTAATLKALDGFPADWPELEWLPVSGFLGTQGNHQTSDPMDGYNYATIATCLVAPLSRGNITINSASMNDPPLINPNWLTDPADVEIAIATFKRQREMWNLLNSYNLTIGPEAYPGPAIQTDAEILTAIRAMVTPIWHAAATCKMGQKTDPMAVIDSEARVYGVQRLRVVDASSFPLLPPGHPQSSVYVIAQKIARQILIELD